MSTNTESNNYADLIFEFFRQTENQYWVRLNFSQPESVDQIAPRSGPAAFDFQALRAASLNPATYGRLLKDAVFTTEDLRSFFRECQARASQAKQALRPRILIDRSALELHNLRWETMRDLNEGEDFLSPDANRPFSRFLSTSDWRRVELRSRGQLRALVVVANPVELQSGLKVSGRDLAPVDVEGELQRARRGLREDPLAQGVKSVPSLTLLGESAPEAGASNRATLENIHQHLLQGYDILYLVAHGALLPDQPNTPNSPMRAYLLLEKDDGSYDRRPGQDLVNAIAALPSARRPRLVVLASCQSGGQGKVPSGGPDEPEHSYDEGALAALGPKLAEAGVPAVIAMQDNVLMSSAAIFMPLFFTQLLQHGQVDLAVATARQALILAKAPDWWVPVLYLRLLGGLLWFEPGFSRKEDFEGWPGIITSLEEGACVPILGFGLLEPLFGSAHEIAKAWADSVNYPLEPHNQDDLTQVSQYLAIKQKPAFPRAQLLKHIRSRLIAEYHLPTEGNENRPIEELVSACADQILADPEQPYNILARLPVRIYINANPDNLIELALRRNNRIPQVMYARWNKSLEDSDTIEASSRLVETSIERPLVYQLFGKISIPKSLVLSEDDYFEYLMWVNNPGAKIRLPEPVITAWRDDALLFLGFQMDDWNFRALFRSILYGDRRQSIRDYPSVAVQLQPGDGYLNVESARRYLADTFKNDRVDMYWGSAQDFLADLNRQTPEGLKV